ncbi:MAG: GNAT family N-acetyltransferase [Desulfobacteraceae bacterium]|nr:GNAT family N-acetyltransferase [Desulfobacteraceae bacterium]
MVIIRAARPADLAVLTGLLKTLFGIEADFSFNEALQQQGLRLMLADKRSRLLVAEAEGVVVGMCSGQLTISTAEGGPALLVEDVVVGERWRGQGIGRRLMAALASWARRHQVSRLQLLADRQNVMALDFYRHLGWQGTELICLRRHLDEDEGSPTT